MNFEVILMELIENRDVRHLASLWGASLDLHQESEGAFILSHQSPKNWSRFVIWSITTTAEALGTISTNSTLSALDTDAVIPKFVRLRYS